MSQRGTICEKSPSVFVRHYPLVRSKEADRAFAALRYSGLTSASARTRRSGACFIVRQPAAHFLRGGNIRLCDHDRGISSKQAGRLNAMTVVQ